MEKIKQWLVDRGTFEEGIVLLMPHCRNRHKIDGIVRRNDGDKLKYELEKLVSIHEPREISETPSDDDRLPEMPEDPDKRLEIIRNGRVRYEDLPEKIRAIYDSTREGYREMRSLHERLKLAEDDDDRRRIRAALCLAEDINRGRWAAIDAWAETGDIWEPEPISTDPVPTDHKSVGAARLSIHRNLPKLETETDPEKIEILRDKITTAVAIITAAGSTFDKQSAALKKHGFLP